GSLRWSKSHAVRRPGHEAAAMGRGPARGRRAELHPGTADSAKLASMNSDKAAAIALIEKLPDDASMEAILAELHFKLHVMKGIDDIDQGRVISHEDMKA